MTINRENMIVTVAGGGNAAHVLLGLLGAHPRVKAVRLWNVMEKEIETWTTSLAERDNQVVVRHALGDKPDTVGLVEKVSVEAADILPGTDMLLIAVPAFAHEVYITKAAPFMKVGMMLGTMVAEGGFDWSVRDILGKRFTDVTTFAMETLPWACRLEEYGHSAVIGGTKDLVHVAVSPRDKASEVCEILVDLISLPQSTNSTKALPKFEDLGCWLSATVMNVNSLFHPAIVQGAFEDFDGVTPYSDKLPFYEGVQDNAANMIEAIGEDCMAVKAALEKAMPDLNLFGIKPIKQFFFDAYPDSIQDFRQDLQRFFFLPSLSSLRAALNTNLAYRGLKHTMNEVEGGYVPSWKARYLTEDIPFGLVPTRGIAEVLNVATPAIDNAIIWCQEKLGKEYLMDGKLEGKHISECRCPQRYGLTTLDDIVTA
ncbi:unnamed protein product [Chrysoparadoxa australica]